MRKRYSLITVESVFLRGPLFSTRHCFAALGPLHAFFPLPCARSSRPHEALHFKGAIDASFIMLPSLVVRDGRIVGFEFPRRCSGDHRHGRGAHTTVVPELPRNVGRSWPRDSGTCVWAPAPRCACASYALRISKTIASMTDGVSAVSAASASHGATIPGISVARERRALLPCVPRALCALLLFK